MVHIRPYVYADILNLVNNKYLVSIHSVPGTMQILEILEQTGHKSLPSRRSQFKRKE